MTHKDGRDDKMPVTIKWFPRSWLQIIYDGKVIYIDPSYLATYFRQHPGKTGTGDDGLPEKMPGGDIILYTHAHKDHCKKATLARLQKTDAVVLGPRGCAKEIGSHYTIVLPNEQHQLRGIGIETIKAHNTLQGRSTKKVHKEGAGIGYILRLGNIKIYHAGDTDFIPEMAGIKDMGIDIAFLPIGGTFTMDIEEAVQAAEAIMPKTVIPIHHVTADPASFCGHFEKSSIKAMALSIGEAFIYP